MKKKRASVVIKRALASVQARVVEATFRAYQDSKYEGTDGHILVSINKLTVQNGTEKRKLYVSSIMLNDRAVLLVMDKRQVKGATRGGERAKMAYLYAEAQDISSRPLGQVYALSRPAYAGDAPVDMDALLPFSGMWLANVLVN